MRGVLYALVETVSRVNGCWAERWDPRDWTSLRISHHRVR
jgi:hypothetical protein